MRSNLPLLFVNGYPTSLTKMSVCELERFIPFMVQCSLGSDRIKECAIPKWWPKDIAYPKAFVKYNKNDEMWKTKLQNLIISCYAYHECNYLLRFCTDLARHPKNMLKFVNNCDSTTSLYNKSTGKLLVTFRNENILYDKIIPARKRKWLKPHDHNSTNSAGLLGILPSMVEEDPVDIYLCDKCDAVLHSFEEMKDHESKCGSDIITISEDNITNVDQENFLNYFDLTSLINENNSQNVGKNISIKSHCEKSKKRDSRTSIPHPLLKCPAIPFSSPAGIFLTKRSRHTVSDQTHTDRRERTERYCEALPSTKSDITFLQDRSTNRAYPINYRKSRSKWAHSYTNPRDVGKHKLDINSQLKYISCKPLSVIVKCNCKLITEKTMQTGTEIINLCSSDEEDSLQVYDSQLNKLKES